MNWKKRLDPNAGFTCYRSTSDRLHGFEEKCSRLDPDPRWGRGSVTATQEGGASNCWVPEWRRGSMRNNAIFGAKLKFITITYITLHTKKPNILKLWLLSVRRRGTAGPSVTSRRQTWRLVGPHRVRKCQPITAILALADCEHHLLEFSRPHSKA